MLEYLSMAQSAVRRINYRMEVLAKQVGTASPIYQREASDITVFFGDNYRFKDGVIQITKPSELYKNDITNEYLEEMDKNFQTWGDIKRQYAEKYEEYQKEAEFVGDDVDSFQAFIEANISLPQAMVWIYSNQGSKEADEALDIMSRDGRMKSYSELQHVISLAQEGGAYGEVR